MPEVYKQKVTNNFMIIIIIHVKWYLLLCLQEMPSYVAFLYKAAN